MRYLRVLLLGLLALAALAVIPLALAGGEIVAGRPGVDHVVVRPEVLDALGQRPEVAVIISLREPEAVPTPPNVTALKQDVAASQGRVLSTLAAFDFTLTRRYEVVPALAGEITAGGVQKLAHHPAVIAISIDGEVHASLAQSVPLINADDVHALGITGLGIEAAVLDTGFDTDHPDLADDLLSEDCFLISSACPGGVTTCSGAGCAEDDNGHGSHVSGIITSGGVLAPVGVAPDAGIRAYKVLNASGSGSFSDIISALDHIIVNYPGTELVNMSLGVGVGVGVGMTPCMQASGSTRGFVIPLAASVTGTALVSRQASS